MDVNEFGIIIWESMPTNFCNLRFTLCIEEQITRSCVTQIPGSHIVNERGQFV
jgi:hypothetical protein